MNRNVRLFLISLPVALLLACLISLMVRTRPGDRPISSNCTWVEDNTRPLNLENRADRSHLRDDAVTAEDVAIRWADKYYGHQSEWDARQYECIEALFDGVAKHHGIDVALVQQYSLERDVALDSTSILSLGILYTLVAYFSAGRIRKRFPTGEPGFWVMTIAMAIGISLAGVMIGMLWSIVMEEIRFNSGHLSYRMNRIPFRQHWAVLFFCGVAIFVLASLVRSRFKSVQHVQGQTYVLKLR